MTRKDLKETARSFPQSPGVYLWRGEDKRVLYVGKANKLRSRVLQYFGRQHEERKERMVDLAASVEFIGVGTPKEALVLEQTLIKQHAPPYNVLLTDDKKYPYIAVTREPWPRVVYTRDQTLKGTFFGPFPDAYHAKRVARMLNQTFRLRQCRTLPARECLYYHLRQCTAPCIQAVAKQDYEQQVGAARKFLQGRAHELRDQLRERMQQASDKLRFERAGELRDLANAIESVLERQRVDQPGVKDADALGFAQDQGRWCALILWIRDGKVMGREHYFLNAPSATNAGEVARAFVEQFYVQARRMPRDVLLPVALDDQQDVSSVLQQVHEHPVRFTVPERGNRRRLVELAERNAHLLLEQERLLRERRGPQALERLAHVLQLREPPNRIECFDVSHHTGQYTVASMVALVDGQPKRSDYRRFRIRSTQGGDDPGAIREVVTRRYERVMREEGVDALPDLVLVDGGRPQLGAAVQALQTLGLTDIQLVALAKRNEEIHRPKRAHAIRLERSDPALHLLQRARDEAHRFAIAFQGKLKRKALLESQLDAIAGVGPERKRRLLTTFGSLDGMRRATAEEIARVPGISRALAKRIHTAVGQKPSMDPPA